MFNIFRKMFGLDKDEDKITPHFFKPAESHILRLDENNNSFTMKKQDQEILSIFNYNKYLLHRVIVPLINFSHSLGIDTMEITRFVRDSYALFKTEVKNLKGLARILNQNDNKKRNELINALSRQYDYLGVEQLVDELLKNNLNHNFLLIGDYSAQESQAYKENLLSICQQYESAQYFLKDFYKYQIQVAFLKVFTFENELSTIENNEDLLKILVNAAFKFQNLNIISEQTYELFLEYTKIQKWQFSQESYWGLIRVFLATKQSSIDFYNPEEIDLGLELKENSLSTIVDKIISEKAYQKYDVEKLIVSIIYEKATSFDDLHIFIKELLEKQKYIKKIKQLALKDDLLNNEYTQRRMTIADIDLMSGIEFENFLCSYFKKQGYQCKTTKASGDQGIDLIATRQETTLAIQAKCYTGTVGNHAVMEAVAGSKYYNANYCMVITNSTFSKSAIELARANGVILWDRQVLIEKLSCY